MHWNEELTRFVDQQMSARMAGAVCDRASCSSLIAEALALFDAAGQGASPPALLLAQAFDHIQLKQAAIA